MPTSQLENPDIFRDSVATITKEGKRNFIHPKKPKGRLYYLRTWFSIFYLIIFFSLPFIKVNDEPLLMLNVIERKFIIFGMVFWPQDFFIFGLTMVTFIIFIVLFTAAFGRLFCGWVCPQTVFMEMLFRKVEFLIEGDGPKQKMLRNSAWTGEKIRKKLTKHTVFFLLSFIIANFFLAYIIGIDELEKIITEPISQHFAGFMAIMIFSAIFYAVYAHFREQACTVVCPYGRLQSVLLDRNSMIVAYDYKRGEPRGKYKKEQPAGDSLGDCIDCYQCVKVCPTGIDIRNGTQMECVGCTACIDACDKMMDAVGRPRGLVRYASETGIAEGARLHYTTRMKMYTGLLIVLTGLLTVLLLTRKDVGGTIVRAGGMLFQERGADSISNLYTIKLTNKTMKDINLTLKLEDAPGRIIEAVGEQILVKKEDQGKGSFFIVLPRNYISKRKLSLRVGLYEGDKKITTIKTNFMGPFSLH